MDPHTGLFARGPEIKLVPLSLRSPRAGGIVRPAQIQLGSCGQTAVYVYARQYGSNDSLEWVSSMSTYCAQKKGPTGHGLDPRAMEVVFACLDRGVRTHGPFPS